MTTQPLKSILCRGGRSGKKVHRAIRGTMQLSCGKVLRGVYVDSFEVADDTAENVARYRESGVLCESCFCD